MNDADLAPPFPKPSLVSQTNHCQPGTPRMSGKW